MTTNTQFLLIMQSSLFRLDGPDIEILESLQNLCDCINEDTLDTDWTIGESLECSLDSLIIGAFWALTECHGGQYSESYAVLCSLGTIFNPGMTPGPEPDSGEQYAYEAICEALTD